MEIKDLVSELKANAAEPITVNDSALVGLIFGLSKSYKRFSAQHMASEAGVSALMGMARHTTMDTPRPSTVPGAVAHQLAKMTAFPQTLTLTEKNFPNGLLFTQDRASLDALIQAAPGFVFTLVSPTEIQITKA